MKDDVTFSDVSAYGSERWCAQALGKSYEWFRKARPSLEAHGFPQRDRLLGLTQKADVLAWIVRRRRLNDAPIAAHHTAADTKTGVDFHAL
ncbi:MAG: hypothetical protein ACRC14_07705 [Paracoccaceae bacterium]